MNRAFKVIKVHLYWCLQKSRMDYCHNVQQCQHYFQNLRRYSNRNGVHIGRSRSPKVDDFGTNRKRICDFL